MRNILLLVAVFLITTLAYAGQGFPKHPNIKNTTLTTTVGVFSLTFPEGTGDISMQSRGANDFKIGTTPNLADGVVFTVKSGTVLRSTNLGITSPEVTRDTTVYLQGTTASQIIETLYWQ